MKLIASGGGTGGHVYPALTVIESLVAGAAGMASRRSRPGAERDPLEDTHEPLPEISPADVLWIGSRGGMEEEMVHRAGIEFIGLPAGGLRGVGAMVSMRNATQIAGSIGRARGILRRFAPDVVLITGGYASVAVGLGAWLEHVPTVIYLPDVVPGLAIRFLSRFATRITVTSEASYKFFPLDKVVVTGYPVRHEVFEWSQAEARETMGLSLEERVLLVFGGSRGARSINRAVTTGLGELLAAAQVVHVSGRLDAGWVGAAANRLPDDQRARYHPYEYLHDMPRALAAADLVIARAGAATLGEFPAAALPAILVPYPHSGQHQAPNAAHLAEAGAAIVVDDADLAEKLVPTALHLLRDEEMLAEMRQAARSLARPDAAVAIAHVLWQVAHARRARTTGARQ
ncbi:MAG: UDP-N-acetylglucosamine--N-acetylmuramyl-(pentapeptide) pyrophosphoryl-undecaprenol N-acetylglucosamine transferase [Anaerolineae bacterium]|nr:UDP-N-acetylglucosamine--N-acetylmuramyl-(pentapeptide) pyrophosphoryl-undecaprenol N-acetylglucosamine transferase [Anaerolineae bacterium]